jgi:hypothetical protein
MHRIDANIISIDFVDGILLAHHRLHADKVETFDKKLQACLQAL